MAEFRNLGRLVKAIYAFLYDYYRYAKYSGWRSDLSDVESRNYLAAKVYHALEKSMSFTSRRKGAGKANFEYLEKIIKYSIGSRDKGFQDYAAAAAIREFSKLSDGDFKVSISGISTLESEVKSGVHVKTITEIKAGLLEDPESFFNSRSSIREFSHESIPHSFIERAIRLSSKAPSACNRQSWHVYYTQDTAKIKSLLRHQNGNRGFEDKIPGLMIITSDLRAFGPSNERYQHWIDGGMYAMSLIYSLHSIGISSCCLNWSSSPKQDLNFRESFEINDSHSIVMMLAFGWPKDSNIVCRSPRRPISEISTDLDKK